jgi:hypothetical protein
MKSFQSRLRRSFGFRAGAPAVAATLLLANATAARAGDVPVAGRSLTVQTSTKTGKTTLKSTQTGKTIGFGTGSNAAGLAGILDVYYIGQPTLDATLEMPPPWQQIVGNGALARFKNLMAPAGPSPVSTATIKTGSSASVTALGDGTLGSLPDPGPEGVGVILTMVNENDATFTRMCTQYAKSLGSQITARNSGETQSLHLSRGVPMQCPTCTDGRKDGHETGVDCGGGCGLCPVGQGCNSGVDCQTGVCSSGICQAPSCFDGVRDGTETGVDCGGGCGGCPIGVACNKDSDCANQNCVDGVCQPCASQAYTFHVDGYGAGPVSDSSWPGGYDSAGTSAGCGVAVAHPSGDVTLVCSLGDSWRIVAQSGYQVCYGIGGPNGDGVLTPTCDNSLASPSVCNSRPSCSDGLYGNGHDDYQVLCVN